MKLLNFRKNDFCNIGILYNEKIVNLTLTAKNNNIEFPKTMKSLIENFATEKIKINQMLSFDCVYEEEKEIEFLEVVSNPQKIICIGLNYKDHKEEVVDFSLERDEFPVMFSKFNNALCGHKKEITIPAVTKALDYEAELVIVIGKKCKNIEKEEAEKFIFGYTVGNDFSARDLQMKTSQWLLGKSLDGFAPIGPYLVTKDELDINNQSIKTLVNGEIRQNSNTNNMIFKCDDIVSYVSKHFTLEPGDLIFTGTPKGVILGMEKEKQIWLKKGDRVTVEIENIGTLENKLI